MPTQGNIRELIEVSQRELHEMIETEFGIIRCGAAANCNNRAKDYERQGYSGRMFFARTENMMKAEDSLLEAGQNNQNCIHNIHRVSNMQEEPGFVYIIKGKLLALG